MIVEVQSWIWFCYDPLHDYIYVNPLRAKFFWGDINIYLHIILFLHIDMTQVAEILPKIRQGPTHFT